MEEISIKPVSHDVVKSGLGICTVNPARSLVRGVALVFALGLALVLGLAGCNPWGELNNPADIGSPAFQGFEVAKKADEIKSYSPLDGAVLAVSPAEFVVSLVTGADAYWLQVSETADFSGTLVVDKADYRTNKIAVAPVLLRRGGTLYWQAKAKLSGVWGTVWTGVRSFTLPRAWQVRYEGNGSTGGTAPVDSAWYLPGASVTVAGNTGSLVKEGFSFSGWNTVADGSGASRTAGSSFVMGSGAVVLYAKWAPTFTVTYDGNGNTGGTVPVDSSRYLPGASVTVAGNSGSLVKDGYSFMGWNTLADGSGTNRTAGSSFVMGSTNVVLYAKWAPTFTVTYDGNGNTGGSVPVDSSRYPSGATVTVAGAGSLVRDGYSFAGWNTSAAGTGTTRAAGTTFAMGSGNVVLYAKWLPTYTVTYSGNGNTGGSVPVDADRYIAGANVTVLWNTESLVKTGYAFSGWNTTADGSGTNRAAGTIFTMGSGNVVLYAKWVPTYTVTYSGNGNSGGTVPIDSDRYIAGASVTVLGNTGSLVKPEFAFFGWNTSAAGTGTDRSAGSAFTMGSGNVVLYAKWSVDWDSIMVSVPGGSFQMGSPEGTPDSNSAEYPVHTVNITGFLMSKYEVTQEQYFAVTGSSPSYFSGTNLPVEQVTWFDAVEFCNKLSEHEGLQKVYTISGRTPADGYPIMGATLTMDMTKNGYRLPTEAEWEYAARGGNGSPGNYTYAGSNSVDVVTWYSGNSESRTHSVGTKVANGLGLYDMSGNIWEWVWDYWYGSYSSSTQNDPTGASSGSYRMIRGGFWGYNAAGCRVAFRFTISPDDRYSYVGFRLVRRP